MCRLGQNFVRYFKNWKVISLCLGSAQRVEKLKLTLIIKFVTSFVPCDSIFTPFAFFPWHSIGTYSMKIPPVNVEQCSICVYFLQSRVAVCHSYVLDNNINFLAIPDWNVNKYWVFQISICHFNWIWPPCLVKIMVHRVWLKENWCNFSTNCFSYINSHNV